MKKYRYYDPSSRTTLERARPYIYLFIGWNLFGIMIWKFMNRKASERDPGWETRSQVEKMSALKGSGSNTVMYKFSPFGSSNEEKNEEDES